MNTRNRLRWSGLVWSLALSAVALGQGTVVVDRPVPHPRRPSVVTTRPLELKYLKVYAEIVDGVAVTKVEQTFHNPLSTPIEGTYLFPLPDSATVSDFKMTMGGKTLTGEVLDAEAARRTYEEIVRRTRDPGLLEYAGGRLYKASVFPIPPRQSVDVKIQYSQTLTQSGGLETFVHPLRSDAADAPVESFAAQLDIRSSLPLASVFCPSHDCDVRMVSNTHAIVSYEAGHVRLGRDLLVYTQRKQTEFGVMLLTHRAPGEAGYFLLRVSPPLDPGDDAPAKDIAFVIDTSGSMSDGKIEQARRALETCINTLGPRDRFNIHAFSSTVRSFRENLTAADADGRQAAVEFTRKLQAVGGTNIHDVLLAALDQNPRDASRPYLIVFMTDGQPTVGVTQPEQIMSGFAERNRDGVRLHVLGVGHDVNTHLLDRLADDSRGSRDYCVPGEDLEIKLGALAGRIARPALTDTALKLAGLNTHDVFPRKLPDLFHGGEISVLGRYEGDGPRTIELSGRVGASPRTITLEAAFPARDLGNDFLPQLWASRKVAHLLDEVRLQGNRPELVQEIRTLATRFGIVTPFTSALILEDQAVASGRGPAGPVESALQPSQAGAARMRAGDADVQVFSRDSRKSAGEASVEASREAESLRGAQSLDYVDATQHRIAGSPVSPGAMVPLRQVAQYTFVHDGRRYLDTRWDGRQTPRQIQAFSGEYFALMRARPELVRVFALGVGQVIVLESEVIEIVPG